MAGGGGIRQQIAVDGKEQVVAAFKEVGSAGEQAFTQVDRGSKTATQSLRSFTREATGMRRATGQLLKNFSDMGRGLESIGGLLGSTLGGVAGGIIGVGLAKVVSGIANSLGDVTERLTKIQQQARELGQRPLVVQAAGEISAAAGQGTDVGERMIAGMTAQLQKVRTETKALSTFDGVKVLKGMGEDAKETAGHFVTLSGAVNNTVKVFRGGVPIVQDLSKPLDVIQVDLSRMKDNSLESKKALQLQLQGFLNFAKTLDPTSQKLNELSKVLFQGVPAESALIVAPKLLADLNKQIAELEASARGATDPALDAATRRTAAIAARNQMFTELTAGITNWYISLDAAVTEAENRFIKDTLPKWSADFSAFFTNSFMPTMQSAWASFIGDMSQLFVAANWTQLWTDFSTAAITSLNGIGKWWGDLIKGMVSSLGDLASWAGQKLSDIAGAAGSILSGAPVPGFAAGGMVHGPGSGTSDSIVARLSAGEFVMRAAAVQHWGAGLLASMNAAVGGLSAPLVPRRPGRFADGGLVTAGAAGGTPVHLHLGGHSFALSGNRGVVSALVTEAHRHQIRSAGTKPSWYGGTPGR